MIDVNHLQGHVLAHFIREEGEDAHIPEFPFLCLLVSGGNSQIILVEAYNKMTILGQTIDDAAGEAFDKCAKLLGGPYPGGPFVDKLAKEGDADAFTFSKPNIPGYDYSFSGLKTSFMYFLRDELKNNPNFVEERKADLCASIQKTVIEVLMKKLKKASDDYKIKRVAVAGGVSANSGLRAAFEDYSKRYGWDIFVPKFSYTTDNAAMIAIAALFKYKDGIFDTIDSVPFSKVVI
jgi:N6-L-threonylcarbamoyladenine synthase